VATLIFVLAFVVLGLGVIFVGMRGGRRGPVFDPQKRSGRRGIALVTGILIAGFGVAVPIAVGIGSDNAGRAGPVDLTGEEQQGRALFATYCAQCHTLGASNAVQLVGPDLDQLRPPAALTLDAIDNGRARGRGQMPSQLLQGPDAEAVARYVERVAGR
jgi:mono/diheme cytochrome c family protein